MAEEIEDFAGFWSGSVTFGASHTYERNVEVNNKEQEANARPLDIVLHIFLFTFALICHSAASTAASRLTMSLIRTQKLSLSTSTSPCATSRLLTKTSTGSP